MATDYEEMHFRRRGGTLTKGVTMLQEIMTREEIEARFKSEWVLVGDPQTTENLEVIKGVVLYHSRNRDELYRKAIELQPKHSAILYTGETPKGMAIIL